MARVARTSLPDGVFHVYSRGAADLVAFPTDVDKGKMLALIRRGERKFDLEVLACVVMSTHFHLVVDAKTAALSKAMQWIKTSYARDFNSRRGRFGTVFAERFSCRALDSETRIAHAVAYVRGNPVAAGLCKGIADWPWAYGSWGLDVAVLRVSDTP